jgi:hypothetical protein
LIIVTRNTHLFIQIRCVADAGLHQSELERYSPSPGETHNLENIYRQIPFGIQAKPKPRFEMREDCTYCCSSGLVMLRNLKY